MDSATLRRYVVWYTGVGATLTVGLLYGVATLVGVDVGSVAVVLLVGALFGASIVAALSTRGIQSASDGSVVGFLAPNSVHATSSSLSLPDRLGLLGYFVGLALLGAATLGYLLG